MSSNYTVCSDWNFDGYGGSNCGIFGRVGEHDDTGDTGSLHCNDTPVLLVMSSTG